MPAPTKEEITAAFTQALEGVVPSEQKQIPIAQKLEPYRDEIMARHTAGFSWKQIAQAMKHPAVNLRVSHMTLRKLFGEKPKKSAKKRQVITSIRVLPPEQCPPIRQWPSQP